MSEITTTKEAVEFLFTSPTSLDELSSNIFQNQSNFKVKVLTRPLFYTSDPEDPESIIFLGTEPSYATKVVFKGRILDANMPHQKFLDDPCSLEYTDDPKTAATLASMHTSITVNRSEQTQNLRVGDIILCETSAGDNNNLYNLQFMNMVSVFQNNEEVISISDLSDCTSLGDLFGDIPGESLDPYLLTGENQVTLRDDACDDPDDFVLMHPLQDKNALITSPFGPRDGGTHNGADFGGNGVPIYAAADGVVGAVVSNCKSSTRAIERLAKQLGKTSVSVPDIRRAKDTDSYYSSVFNCGGTGGNSITIKHEDAGYITYYGHLAEGSIKVQVGQDVKQGDQIANVGNTGYSTGPHLHFQLNEGVSETRAGGTPVDPIPFILTEKKCPSS